MWGSGSSMGSSTLGSSILDINNYNAGEQVKIKANLLWVSHEDFIVHFGASFGGGCEESSASICTKPTSGARFSNFNTNLFNSVICIQTHIYTVTNHDEQLTTIPPR